MNARILIVDDEFGLADVVAEILIEAGYEVSIAINGQLGLASMAERRPDLVLLDVMMPVMDGPTMLEKMRAEPEYAEIPVLMMTSLPDALPPVEDALYQAVLSKPFTYQKLLAVVAKMLGDRPDHSSHE